MRSVARRVSKPESKRMIASAIEPRKKAAGPLLNAIPPSPSSPASNPSPRKTRSSGAPKRKLRKLVKIEATTRAEAMRTAIAIEFEHERCSPPLLGADTGRFAVTMAWTGRRSMVGRDENGDCLRALVTRVGLPALNAERNEKTDHEGDRNIPAMARPSGRPISPAGTCWRWRRRPRNRTRSSNRRSRPNRPANPSRSHPVSGQGR